MPHYRCKDCQARLQIEQAPSAVFLCPECCSVLDPVEDLNELIGLRRITFSDGREPGEDEFAGCFQDPAAAVASDVRPSSQALLRGKRGV